MKKLTNLLIFSTIIFFCLFTYIYIRNFNNFGYIVLFDTIPLYKHISHDDNIWLTGMLVFYALVNVSVFVGYFLYHFIIYKNIYCFDFTYQPNFKIIPTTLASWIWLTSFDILLEMVLYGKHVKFRSLTGININYFDTKFTNQPIFSDKNSMWILLIILFVFFVFIKYVYPPLKELLIEAKNRSH